MLLNWRLAVLVSASLAVVSMSYLEWAEAQLAEIELLSSMFPGRDELEMTDPLALAELRDYVERSDSTDSPPACRPQFLVKQTLDSSSTETVTECGTLASLKVPEKHINDEPFLSCVLAQVDVILSCAYPSEYPSVLPEVTVR